MNIEIDYEVAIKLTNDVLVQDYESLLENGCYYSGSDESYTVLLEAYRRVIEYYTV